MTATLPTPAAGRNGSSGPPRRAAVNAAARYAPTCPPGAYLIENARCPRATCGGDVMFDPATRSIWCPACARRREGGAA